MKNVKIIIKGLVQGIGYRPFVVEMAEKLNINGNVKNTAGIVTVHACGEDDAVNLFVERLKVGPSGAKVLEIQVFESDAEIEHGFYIVDSESELKDKIIPYIPSDMATCSGCEAELKDASNRRYRHPFISCTACGPRYSIINRLPYDRENITMDEFKMCPICSNEYVAKGDRRRHAQTIACPNCGPVFSLCIGDDVTKENAFDKAVCIIKEGGIVALKDIGGFHLVCRADLDEVVSKLRILKHREKKPFAVMFSNVEQIKEYCELNDLEQKELESIARPIVLLKRKKYNKLAKGVCNSSAYVGAMLPCNPAQILMVEEIGPVVMTSANYSGDLMITDNEVMRNWMKERQAELDACKLAVLSHDREILTPLDDSIVQVVENRRQLVRRARGFVPDSLKVDANSNILALGGDLKATFCYVENGKAVPSQNFGDLDEENTNTAYKKEIDRVKDLFGFEPDLVATDEHPLYNSAEFGNSLDKRVIRINHHKAHVASVIAEHNLKHVLGVAFDGTGYGEDKTIWGSEIFVWQDNTMKRVAHLKQVDLMGGDAGSKNAKNSCYSYLVNYGIKPDFELFKELKNEEYDIIKKAIELKINTVKSSSMGRLFDAVSALLGICYYNDYEGQAPMELQYLAEGSDTENGYHIDIERDGICLVGNVGKLFLDIINDIEAGREKSAIARGFINSIAEYVRDIAVILREEGVIDKGVSVALSGGTFLNKILLSKTIRMLENSGFMVYINEQVPPSDAGLCLGQAFLADKMV